jgi:hypothetical protein
MAKAAKTEVSRYVPTPESMQMRKEIEEYYAGIIPDMRRAFAHYVFKQGQGAKAPTVDRHGRQETWQAVGRRLYGPAFMEDMRAVIEENRTVANQ